MIKIKNYKLKITNFERGFSLVEALVVLGVVVIMGYILSDLLLRTFQGGTKADLIGTIKQNGQTSLETITSSIRSADAVVCSGNYTTAVCAGNNNYACWPASNSSLKDTLVVAKSGVFTRFRLYPPADANSNGYLTEDNPIPPNNDLSLSANLCGTSGTNGSSLTSPIYLTDKNNTTTGVSVVSGGFLVNQNPGFKPTVLININLNPPIGVGNKAYQTIASSLGKFSTTVQLR